MCAVGSVGVAVCCCLHCSFFVTVVSVVTQAQLNGASPTSSLCAVGPSIDSLVQPGAAGVAGMAALQSPLQYASAGASQVPPNMVLIPPSANGQHDYSLTNLYIRGLGPNTKDADLYNMCCE